MKRLNKKGFVLVETLIVTAFVMTLFILVYQNVVPYIGEYEKMSSYDDIDSVYATNLLKQGVLRYGNFDNIDTYLESNTFMDITDCNDSNIYINNDYCEKIKKSLSILEDDYIFITKYDIEEFREETKTNEFFDSGKLSAFKDYVATVPSVDSFYDIDDEGNSLVGKYRLFVTRTVTNSDTTTTLKYTNLGIYTGKYKRYNLGDKVVFNTGDKYREFYVLKHSSTSDSTVTLIASENLNGYVKFNDTGTGSIPNTALNHLKNNTSSWTNAQSLNNYSFISTSGYTISYNGYYARLLQPSDLYEVLGCNDNKDCFNTSSMFSIKLDTDVDSWLSNGLGEGEGYWLASSVSNNNEMAWTIKKGNLTPVIINDETKIGVRPVIIVDKNKIS